MLFAGGHLLCFQTGGTAYQYSIWMEILVIYHLVSACICYQMLQKCKAPCHHRNFFLTFLIRGGLILSSVGGNNFLDYFLECIPSTEVDGVHILYINHSLSLNPIVLLTSVTILKEDRWRGIQVSVWSQLQLTASAAALQCFTRTRTS